MRSDVQLDEAWARVGLAPQYEVSDAGRIRRAETGRFLAVTPRANGYVSVPLVSAVGKKSRFYVHRLVADAFCGGLQAGKEVNHINFIRHDNRATNLEVVSRRENIDHSKVSGRYLMNGGNSPRGDKSIHSKLTSAEVARILAERQAGRKVKDIAAEHGISERQTYNILSGASWNCAGAR